MFLAFMLFVKATATYPRIHPVVWILSIGLDLSLVIIYYTLLLGDPGFITSGYENNIDKSLIRTNFLQEIEKAEHS